MKLSNKLGILTFLCLLTAFPLGYIDRALILISFIGCGIFSFWFWFQSEYEGNVEIERIESEEREKMLKENRKHMKLMENLVKR